MIVGIGIQLVEVPRFEAALDRFGDRLLARLFTADERAYASAKLRGAESLAARFAAKLAARVALAAPGLAWRELEVVRERRGAPRLRLHGAAREAARRTAVDHIALTLTHDAQWCLGQVVLESHP